MESPKSPRVSTTRYTLGKRLTFRRPSNKKRRGAMNNTNRQKLRNMIYGRKPPRHPGVPVAARGRSSRAVHPPPPPTVVYANTGTENTNYNALLKGIQKP